MVAAKIREQRCCNYVAAGRIELHATAADGCQVELD